MPYDVITEEFEFIRNAGYMIIKIFQESEQILTNEQLKMENLTHRVYLSTSIICRKYGVKIYSNIVINLIFGNGNDIYPEYKDNDYT